MLNFPCATSSLRRFSQHGLPGSGKLKANENKRLQLSERQMKERRGFHERFLDMMTHNLFSRSAPLAIAASGALFASAAMAQDAAPVDTPIVLPPLAETTAAPATTAPAPIVLPDTVVEAPAPVAAPAPVTIASPEPVAARTIPRAQRPAAPRAEARPTVIAPAAASAEAAPVSITEAVPVTAEAIPAEVAPLPVEPAQVATADHIDEGLLAGLLGAAGIALVGGVAFASSRRRRTRASAKLHDTVVAYSERPAHDQPVVAAPVAASSLAAHRQPEPSHANGDPVPLPDRLPATVEERVALIDRLAAAKPDRANPFTSRKARVKRARMIVNSLGLNFANRKPRIDLSEYTSRWPALRGWQPATS